MKILLAGGRVLDPGAEGAAADRVGDIFIEDGCIAALPAGARPAGVEVVDCKGLVVAPGFVDLHVHFREPGQEYKEDIASGSRAAAAGGFTTVCCMPNTNPPNDNRSVTDLIVRQARERGVVRLHPIGAISKGLKGESLAEIAEMKDAGVVAISDDGRPVMNADLMRRALEYARTFDLPVVQHAEDLQLARGGVMNEGPAATRAGLRGQPAAAETVMVLRDLELVALTGARYHVAHVSTAGSVRAVRDAKQRGLAVTCEVTPHHLTLTDIACCGYDTATKCAPPLRSEADREALIEGLCDGTIDCIATDHAPHALQEKQLEFQEAAFGIIGLETALGLAMKLVEAKRLSLPTLVQRMTLGAAKIFGLAGGTLRVGAPADVTVFDPAAKQIVDAAAGRSKSRNTPFQGWELSGVVMHTLVAGKPVYRREVRS
jgi:dihydroorotase